MALRGLNKDKCNLSHGYYFAWQFASHRFSDIAGGAAIAAIPLCRERWSSVSV
jgi:hypothetical protein